MANVREYYGELLKENPQLKFVSLERGLLEEIVEDFGSAEARIRELEAERGFLQDGVRKLEAHADKLADERDEAMRDFKDADLAHIAALERAEKAEAENARLREAGQALRDIVGMELGEAPPHARDDCSSGLGIESAEIEWDELVAAKRGTHG